MTDEEKEQYEKISPMTEGQMSMKCSGYDAGANGVGIRCQPLQVIVRKHVEWTGSPDFEAAPPSSWEEKAPTPEDFGLGKTKTTAADF